MENLENILESILFTNGDAVDISDITSKIDVTKAEINKAVNKLKAKYNESSGIVLLTFNNKLQLASSGKYANEVALVLNQIRQRNLSKATLETASIIAYKQPVTRMEIEEVRGVSSDYAINILLEHNLIEVVGRKDAVGKPILFGTTDEFLKRFNLSSISDLPDYNTLLEKVRVIESKDDRLYNHFEVKSDSAEQEVAVNPEDIDPVIGETYEEDFKPEEKKSKSKQVSKASVDASEQNDSELQSGLVGESVSQEFIMETQLNDANTVDDKNGSNDICEEFNQGTDDNLDGNCTEDFYDEEDDLSDLDDDDDFYDFDDDDDFV